MNESEIDYEIEFREWFENQVANEDSNSALVATVYKPLYLAFLAGANCAAQAISERIRTHTN